MPKYYLIYFVYGILLSGIIVIYVPYKNNNDSLIISVWLALSLMLHNAAILCSINRSFTNEYGELIANEFT